MIISGQTHRVGDNISCADICDPAIEGEHPAELAAHCLERVDPTLAEHVRQGDVLVAGSNFGSGDPAEHAVFALQALGFAAVLCVSAAPAFTHHAETYGMPVVCLPEAATLKAGQHIRIDLVRAVVKNIATQQQFSFPAVSQQALAAIRRAAILGGMRRIVEEEGFEG